MAVSGMEGRGCNFGALYLLSRWKFDGKRELTALRAPVNKKRNCCAAAAELMLILGCRWADAELRGGRWS